MRGVIRHSFLMLGLALTTEAAAKERTSTAKTSGKPGLPIYVGFSVIRAVDDLRDSINDFILAIQQAGPRMGYTDWKAQQGALRQMQGTLVDINLRLLQKSKLNDDNTIGFYRNTPEFGTTVHRSVSDMAVMLGRIGAGFLQGADKTRELPARVANQLTHELDDVREETSELVQEIKNAGNRFSLYNWTDDSLMLNEYQTRLALINRQLNDRPHSGNDAWIRWFGEAAYKKTLSDATKELSSILGSMAQSLSGIRPQSAAD